MRAVVQRVTQASVTVEGEVVGEVGPGLLVLLAAGGNDTDRDLDWMVRKVLGLRIFEDDDGKMNRDLLEVGGSLLVVSQFTLYGDCRKGRRPSFVRAASPDVAEPAVDRFVERARAMGVHCETGRFRTTMSVSLVNQGPVTLLLDSEKTF